MGFVRFGRPLKHKKRRIAARKPVQTKPELTALPPEILIQIFCHSNQNNLHLTNRFFHRILRLDHFSKADIHQLINTQFLVDLNEEFVHLAEYSDKLIAYFQSKSITSDILPKFITHYHQFKAQRYGMDSRVFNYKFCDDEYVGKCIISGPSLLVQERHHRKDYIKSQLKKLNDELIEFRKNGHETNYDELSRAADAIFDDNDNTIEPEDYKPVAIPYIEDVFGTVRTQDQFLKMQRLIEQFGFQVRDLDEFLVRLTDSKQSVGFKIEVLKYLYFVLVEPFPAQARFTDKFLISLFELYVKTNHEKLEDIIHVFLRQFFAHRPDDSRLWEFAKAQRHAGLIHILCEYSAPNFTL